MMCKIFLISRLVHFKNTYWVLWTSVKIVLCQPLKKNQAKLRWLRSCTYQQIPWNFTQDYLVWVGTSTTAIVGRALLLKKNSICWTKEGNITNITGGLVNYSKGKKCNHALPNSNENHLLWCRSRDFVAHIKSSCRRETFDGHVKMQVYLSIKYVYQTKNISEIVFHFSRPDFRLGCYLLYWLYPNFHHLVCRHY